MKLYLKQLHLVNLSKQTPVQHTFNKKTLVSGRMEGWMEGWMDGRMDGRESGVKDCLQQSKTCIIKQKFLM